MRKLFFFTEFYHPVQNTTGYYLTKIVHMAGRCLQTPVQVCCAVPSHTGEVNVSPNLSVDRIQVRTYDRGRTIHRIVVHATMAIKFLSYAVSRVGSGDVVFAVTNPPFLMLSLALLRKMKSFRYVLLVYDVHPDNMVAAGLVRKDSLAHRFVSKCFNRAYGAVDEVIVIGRDMEEVLRPKVGKGCRITQIPNWADVDAVRPQPKADNELIRARGLQDKTVFLFAGNLGRVQGIENLLQAIAMTRNSSAAFLFVGDGALQPRIEQFIREHPEKTVVHHGRFPMSAQQLFLNACDVAIVSLDEAMYGLGVPSKSYFLMAAGKPLLLIADRESEIGRVIQEEDIGWIVPPSMPEALARKIDEICSMSSLEGIGRRARTVVECRFSEEVVLSRYAEYFRGLLGQNGTS